MKSHRFLLFGMAMSILFLCGALLLQTNDQPRTEDRLVQSLDSEEKHLIHDLQEQITALTEELKGIRSRNQGIKASFQQHSMELSKLRKLITSIPQIQSSIAYILSEPTNENNRIELDYVEWLTGDEAIEAGGGSAPNGFYIKNQMVENAAKKIDESAHIYIIDGVTHQYVELAAFKDQNLAHRLFWIYEVDETIVLIEEQYLP